MAIIKFLGTSASIPNQKRDNTSFFFKYKNISFLVDCPGSISHKLLKAGEDYKKIKQIIITHHHPDHIYGIVSLIHTQMHSNKDLTIFSSLPSIKIIKKLTEIFRLNKPGYPKIKYVNVFKNKYFFFKNNLKIKALGNIHIEKSFGLYFSFGKKKMFYSSDTAFSKNLLQKAGKINYLIHEATASSYFAKKYPEFYKMHTTSRQLAFYLKSKPSVTLIPVHFLLSDKKEIERIKKELAGLKKVIFVRDYQKLKL